MVDYTSSGNLANKSVKKTMINQNLLSQLKDDLEKFESERDYKQIANLAQKLGELYQRNNNFKEAELFLKKAFSAFERLFSSEDPNLVPILNAMSALYFEMGMPALAEPFCKKLTSIYAKTHGSEHPEVAIGLTNLALIAQSKNQYEKACQMLKGALLIREKALGKNNIEVARSLINLSNLELMIKDYTKACSYSKKALAIVQEIIEPNDLEIIYFYEQIVEILILNDELSEALEYALKILNIKEIKLGPNHQDVCSTLLILARIYTGQQKFDIAFKSVKRALTMKERVYGNNHLNLVPLFLELATISQMQENFSQAEDYLRQSLQILERNDSPANNPLLDETLFKYANLYQKQKRYAKAKPYWLRLIELRQKFEKANLDELCLVKAKLMECSYYQKDIPETKKYLSEILNTKNNIMVDSGIKVAQSLNSVALDMVSNNNFELAEPMLQKAIDLKTKYLGPNHQELVVSLKGMSLILGKTFRESEAEHIMACANKIIENNEA